MLSHKSGYIQIISHKNTLKEKIHLDFGRINPRLYVSEIQTDFLINIALKYSIIDNTISVIIFKFSMQVEADSTMTYEF